MSSTSSLSSLPAGGWAARLMSAVLGLMVWAALALLGLVFAFSLAIWLLVMLAVSLISSLFTGRPPAVAVLWRRWRDMTRQRWPTPRSASPTPRADAASATGAAPTAAAQSVQDVRWRDVPRQP